MIMAMKHFLPLLLALQVAFAGAPPKVYWDTMRIKNSKVLPGNLLPVFLFMQTHVEGGSAGVTIGGGKGVAKPFIPDDTCTDDIFEGAMADMRSPQLPYLTQDQWTCDRTLEDISVLIYENDDLRVTITPEQAGKIWAVYDKNRQREWLYNNKAHQPANIGALKAWTAGGAEWNWSPGIVGHSAFTESPAWTTIVETEKGPMVRVFEFDRYNGTVWQVDILLDGDTLWAHPRVTNPTDKDLRGYWWTCVAVDAKPETRIFAPATHVAETSAEPMRDAPWPIFAGSIQNSTFDGLNKNWREDYSYLGNLPTLADFFLRIPDSVYSPYIAHTEGDGFVLVHGHPLNGTKFFTWGQNGPGRFMQDFLGGGAENREGDYTELQVGPAPTQMQNFPVPAFSQLQWSEWFRAFDTEPSIMDDEYDIALNEIDRWMRSEKGVPKEYKAEMDAFFERYASVTPSKLLSPGMPWGALEELRLGSKLQAGLEFALPEVGTLAYDEAKPWLDLLINGTFSEETLQRIPLSFQTTDGWMELIEQSALKFGYTWLHYFHLGVGLMERGDVSVPREMFKASLKLRANPVSARNLGLLSSTYEEAWEYYKTAWDIINDEWTQDAAYGRLMTNLVAEMCNFLQTKNWINEMKWFVPQIPIQYHSLDAVITTHIKIAMSDNNVDYALDLLGSNCFPTYARNRQDLMDIWNSAQETKHAIAAGRALTYVERHQVRVSNPPPRNIGCPYAADYCSTYW